MRASRLLSLLLTLSARGQRSATELAVELEVSVRTIYRDVEALSAAGVPVYTTRGRGGGVHLLEGYRTRLTGLTRNEAEALFLSGVPGVADDLGLGGVLAASQLKVLAGLPPDLRARAELVRDRFLLDAPGWLRESEPPSCLTTVAGATWSQQRIEARYERSNRTTVARVLEPLGVVLKAGTWYVVAIADVAGGDTRSPRTYRVSRLQDVTLRPETFERPDGFELATFWAQYQRDYERRMYPQSARIALDPAGRELLFLVGGVPARHAHTAMSPPDGTGWAATTLPVESVRHAVHALLQLGEHVEVLEPIELRERVAATAQALAQLYASPAPRASP